MQKFIHVPKFARTLSEKITGSCGMMEICWRSCFKCVVLVASPLTNISPDIPLLIRNNAEIKLLFPAPVRPTLSAEKNNISKWAEIYEYFRFSHYKLIQSFTWRPIIIICDQFNLIISFPMPIFSPGWILKFIDLNTSGPSAK